MRCRATAILATAMAGLKSSDAFSIGNPTMAAPSSHALGATSVAVARRTRSASVLQMFEKIPSPDASSLPVRTAVLACVSTACYLASNGSDSIGNAGFSLTIPVWILLIQDWLKIFEESPPATKVSLNDMECQLTLNVGREPGTFMPKDWGASGARFSLPLRVRFSDEVVDLDYCGEATLNPSGGRYAKKLYCEGGSFVGAQGEAFVRSTGGAWSAEQRGRQPGASSLNFFLDFPEEAVRNDVTLPAGRVFFSCACWDSERALPSGMLDGDCPMPQIGGRSALDAEPAGVVAGQGGVFLLDKGGLSIKKSDARNFWGAFGEGFFTLGNFRVTAVAPVIIF